MLDGSDLFLFHRGNRLKFVARETCDSIGIELVGTYLGHAKIIRGNGEPYDVVHLTDVTETLTGLQQGNGTQITKKPYVVNQAIKHFDYVVPISSHEEEMIKKPTWKVVPRNNYNAINLVPHVNGAQSPIILNARVSQRDAQVIANALNSEYERGLKD